MSIFRKMKSGAIDDLNDVSASHMSAWSEQTFKLFLELIPSHINVFWKKPIPIHKTRGNSLKNPFDLKENSLDNTMEPPPTGGKCDQWDKSYCSKFGWSNGLILQRTNSCKTS